MSASARGDRAGPRPVPRRLLSERRLARLAAAGDAAAFEVIFKRYHQELYRYCRAILSDSGGAEDALQSTMVAALRALPGERREISLRPWLYRVAHNEAMSILRQRAPAPADEERIGSAPSAAVDARERERLRELVADLEDLPDRQRGALVMRELSGLSYAQIATALSCSEAAARQTVYEAREAMRERGRGRELDCVSVREAISARDGRILRGRAVRAHLRDCESCDGFRAAIFQRRSDLQALAPPLPALAASGLLASVLGGAKAGGGAAAGAAATGSSAMGGIAGAGGLSAAVKGNALLAALIVGAGAAGVAGVGGMPGLGGAGGESGERAPAPSGAAEARPADARPATAAGPSASGGNKAEARRGDEGKRGSQGRSEDAPGHNGKPARGDSARGADGVSAPPAQATGTGTPDSAGTGTGNAGGSSASAPGRSDPLPQSEQGTIHSNAGQGAPPEQANGQGNPHNQPN